MSVVKARGPNFWAQHVRACRKAFRGSAQLIACQLYSRAVILLVVKVFAVLADPTRRRIVELLASGDKSAGELGAKFKLKQPTVSKHLRVLRNAGLVRWRWEAQRRVYRLDARPLAEIIRWLSRYREFFETLDLPDDSRGPSPRGKSSGSR